MSWKTVSLHRYRSGVVVSNFLTPPAGDPAALANVNKGWNNGTWDGSRVTDTDWADIVTQTGITHEHTISGSGGNETAQAFFSIGYLNNQGTQKGQEYERYNFSMSVDLQVKPWFKMGGSINGSWAVQDYGYSRTGQSSGSGPVDIYSAAKAIPRFGVPYDEEGNIITNPCGSTTNVYTVIDEWNKSTDNRQTFRALGSFYGQFDFGKIWAPLEGLSYKISFGPDFRHYRQGIFISKDSAVKMGSKNYAKYATDRYLSWTLDNQINYNKTFGKHNLGVTLLQSASKYNKESGSESANAIPNENFEWYNMGSVIYIPTSFSYVLLRLTKPNNLDRPAPVILILPGFKVDCISTGAAPHFTGAGLASIFAPPKIRPSPSTWNFT